MKDLESIAKKYLDINNLFLIEISLLSIFDKDIFGLVKYKNTYYSIYFLQNRMFIKNNKLVDMREVLITDFNISDLEKLLYKEISIYEFLEKTNKYSIGKINNKQFPIKEIKSLSEIEDKIVEKDVYLNLSNDYITEILGKIKNEKI